jgi:hypothetical protein
MLNEGNQIHNFISSTGFNELWFRFHKAKSYGSYGSGSGSTTLDIRHVLGKANVVADALSRPPPSAVASVKEPPGSPATARQGGKPNTSTPSVPEQRSTASAAAGAARPPLSAVVSEKNPLGL